MKNMIITMGLILLMSLGMIHDGDSLHMMRQQLKLRSICHEMADGACAVLQSDGTLEEAKAFAEEILRRNGDTEAEWKVEVSGNTVTVKVRTGGVSLQGPVPQPPLRLTYTSERKIAS